MGGRKRATAQGMAWLTTLVKIHTIHNRKRTLGLQRERGVWLAKISFYIQISGKITKRKHPGSIDYKFNLNFVFIIYAITSNVQHNFVITLLVPYFCNNLVSHVIYINDRLSFKNFKILQLPRQIFCKLYNIITFHTSKSL